ncbi:30S ribosomal protein S9 [Nonomuraea dietziae]|uniref:30S ribosomal protein S9 n=1 Tax=Nonomuraea dietziae TaxID=65515 RepID=UPI0031D5D920
MRIVPCTHGKWTINGRVRLTPHFSRNKVHQQIVNRALSVVLGCTEGTSQTSIARHRRRRVTGQAGALRMGLSRALAVLDVTRNKPSRPLKKAGRLPHP